MFTLRTRSGHTAQYETLWSAFFAARCHRDRAQERVDIFGEGVKRQVAVVLPEHERTRQNDAEDLDPELWVYVLTRDP